MRRLSVDEFGVSTQSECGQTAGDRAECGSLAGIRDCLELLLPINDRRAEVVETVQKSTSLFCPTVGETLSVMLLQFKDVFRETNESNIHNSLLNTHI